MNKSIAILVVCSVMTQAAASQPPSAYTFAGTPWLSSRAQTRAALTAAGYRYFGFCKDVYSNCTSFEQNDQIFRGMYLNNLAEISAVYDPQGRLVQIYLTVDLKKGQILSTYNTSVELLKKKYGAPSRAYQKFEPPYTAKIVFEALAAGKAEITTDWYAQRDNQGRDAGISIYLGNHLKMWVDYYSPYQDEEYRRRTGGHLRKGTADYPNRSHDTDWPSL